MDRQLLRPLLGAAIPLVLIVISTWTAADESRLEHVLVTVPMSRQQAGTALPVTVLSGDALRQQAAANLGETLGRQPGLASASFGPAVGQPVIRGQQGPRVRVLQNGIASLDAAGVSADHAVTTEPLLADSIEVLRGPATLLYGGGAIGGVVNVIDNRIPDRPLEGSRLDLELRHGTGADEDTVVFRGEAGNGTLNGYVGAMYRDWGPVEIRGSAWRSSVAGRHDEPAPAGGRLHNSDGRAHQWTVGGSRIIDQGYLGLAVSRLENAYGIPPGGHAHAHAQHDEAEHGAHAEEIRLEMEQWRIDLAGEYQLRGWLETLRARLAYSDYEHEEREGGRVATVYRSEGWEGRLEAMHGSLSGWQGVTGLQWQQSDFVAEGAERFVPPASHRGVGLFVIEGRDWRDWTTELGLRIDQEHIRAPGHGRQSFHSISASASLLWAPVEYWQLGLALSRSERAPVVEELLSNADRGSAVGVVHGATQAIEIGDPGLDTEVAHNVDLTGRWQWNGWVLEGALFYNDFRRYIHLAHTGLEAEWPIMHYRQRGARFRGMEYEVALPPWMTPWGVLGVHIYGDVIRGELAGGSAVPRMPSRRVGLRVELDRGPVQVFTDVLHGAAQRHSGAHESSTPAYTRWDAGVRYQLPLKEYRMEGFVRLHNLTNARIRNASSPLRDIAPEPGRTLMAGLRWSF